MVDLPKRLRRWGWICFSIMWLPFASLFVAMIGMPSGDYAWSELPILARASILVGGGFAAASTVLLTGAPLVSGLMNRRLLTSGRPASAKILAITDTGTTINQNPVIRFLLEVRPSDRPGFQAVTEKLVSRLQVPRFQPGSTVQVRYDPETQAAAIVDDDSTSEPFLEPPP